MMSSWDRLRRQLAAAVLGRRSNDRASGSARPGPYNAADLWFVRYLIGYHEQTLRMARLARQRSNNPCVLDIAAHLLATRPEQIDELTACLRTWAAPLHQPAAFDPTQDAGPPGRAEEALVEDTAYFATSSGDEFEAEWLHRLITAYRGAIGAARDEQAAGMNRHAMRIARRLESGQWKALEPMLACLRAQPDKGPPPHQEKA